MKHYVQKLPKGGEKKKSLDIQILLPTKEDDEADEMLFTDDKGGCTNVSLDDATTILAGAGTLDMVACLDPVSVDYSTLFAYKLEPDARVPELQDIFGGGDDSFIYDRPSSRNNLVDTTVSSTTTATIAAGVATDPDHVGGESNSSGERGSERQLVPYRNSASVQEYGEGDYEVPRRLSSIERDFSNYIIYASSLFQSDFQMVNALLVQSQLDKQRLFYGTELISTMPLIHRRRRQRSGGGGGDSGIGDGDEQSLFSSSYQVIMPWDVILYLLNPQQFPTGRLLIEHKEQSLSLLKTYFEHTALMDKEFADAVQQLSRIFEAETTYWTTKQRMYIPEQQRECLVFSLWKMAFERITIDLPFINSVVSYQLPNSWKGRIEMNSSDGYYVCKYLLDKIWQDLPRVFPENITDAYLHLKLDNTVVRGVESASNRVDI